MKRLLAALGLSSLALCGALLLSGWTHGVGPTLNAIPNSFFSVTVGCCAGSNPTTQGSWTVGYYGKTPQTSWPYVQPTSPNANGLNCTPLCTYNWHDLDTIANVARAQSVKMMYTMGGSPGWAVANHAAGTGSVNSITGQWVSSLPPDDLGSLDTFMAALHARYSDVINLIECWNEPQASVSNGVTIANVVLYCNHMHDWLRANWPTVLISTPSIEPRDDCLQAGYFYYDYFAAGGTTDVDVVTWHAYAGFSTGGDTPSVIYSRFQLTISCLLTPWGLQNKQRWDSEGGWNLDTSRPELAGQSAFVSQDMLIHWQLGAKVQIWYGYIIAGWGTLINNSTLALLQPGVAYQQTRLWMAGAATPNPCAISGTVWTCEFIRSYPLGYSGLAVFDTSGPSVYTVPAHSPPYTQYRDTAGGVTSTTTGAMITLPDSATAVGTLPIIIETQTP